MDSSTRKLPSVLSIMAMALGTAIPAVVFAQQGLKEQIVGTWTPVSQYVDQDGKRLEPFGSNPKGIVIYDSNGRFVLVLQRASLPKFEPPRILRRLQFLRRWSHEQVEQVFT